MANGARPEAVIFDWGGTLSDYAAVELTRFPVPPPEGVTMLGRWHSIGGGEGFLVCESDSSEAIARWMQEWSDRLRFRVLPVRIGLDALVDKSLIGLAKIVQRGHEEGNLVDGVTINGN